MLRGSTWLKFTVVTGDERYPRQIPHRRRLRANPDAELRLITCGGVFNASVAPHDDNLIVYAVVGGSHERHLVADRYRLGRASVPAAWDTCGSRATKYCAETWPSKKYSCPTASPKTKSTNYMRTLREARAAARLSHPSVIRIYDVLQADDRPWIVMEYVPSRSLAQVIMEDGPLPQSTSPSRARRPRRAHRRA